MGKEYSVADEGFGGVKVIVFSDRAHASLLKAAALVGIGRKNFVQLGHTALEIEAQLRTCGPGTGRGAIVSWSYGEVNTVCSNVVSLIETERSQGEFTKGIEDIRALCDKYHVWLHIDAGRNFCGICDDYTENS